MKTDAIIEVLGRLSKLWLQKDYSFRKKAVERLVKHSGYSAPMANALLGDLFKELTKEKLSKLLEAELGSSLVLERFVPRNGQRGSVRARGPRRILHIFAGNVPNPAILSFIFGMLLKSENIGKASSEDPGFLDIYLRSLKELSPGLARTNRLIPPSDRSAVYDWMKKVDRVVAYGSDETLKELKKRAGVVPFEGYGHRVSFSIYLRESLTKRNVNALAKKTAYDLWMMDQKGCLSPVVLYAQRGGAVSPSALGRLTASELRKLSLHEVGKKNRGFLSAAAWMTRQNARSVRQVSFIREFSDLKEVHRALRPFEGRLQAVALEAKPGVREKIAEEFSRLGVNRICRAGQMQRPPLLWHHDGRPNLSDWVRWTDLEP
jgi:hypothetical protein